MLLFRWTGSTPDMTTLYLAAMDRLYQARSVHCWSCASASCAQHACMQCWHRRMLRTCRAHAQVSPTTLFFIEGCGQLGSAAAMNWQGHIGPLSCPASMHAPCMRNLPRFWQGAMGREACQWPG